MVIVHEAERQILSDDLNRDPGPASSQFNVVDAQCRAGGERVRTPGRKIQEQHIDRRHLGIVIVSRTTDAVRSEVVEEDERAH